MQHFGGFRGAGFWLEVVALAVDAGVPVPRVTGRMLRTTRGNRLWLFQSNLNSSRPPYVSQSASPCIQRNSNPGSLPGKLKVQSQTRENKTSSPLCIRKAI